MISGNSVGKISLKGPNAVLHAIQNDISIRFEYKNRYYPLHSVRLLHFSK